VTNNEEKQVKKIERLEARIKELVEQKAKVNSELTLTKNRLSRSEADLRVEKQTTERQKKRIEEYLKRGSQLLDEIVLKNDTIRGLENEIKTKKAELDDCYKALESVLRERKEKDKKLDDYQEKYRLKIEEYNQLKTKRDQAQNTNYQKGIIAIIILTLFSLGLNVYFIFKSIKNNKKQKNNIYIK
jgi:chromosome segregation ATPase